MSFASAYRLYAVSRPVDAMNAAIAQRPKAAVVSELLGHEIPENKAELFAISDLAGVGLAGYLTEGQGIPQNDIAADRAKLDGLDGFVLLLLPYATDRDLTLPDGSDLTLIGTYHEVEADMDAEPIETASAELYSGARKPMPTQPISGRAGSAMAILALIVIALLLLWWVLK